jgi:predicted AlkP superfamily pyrophosphatase or phosphodiesterase
MKPVLLIDIVGLTPSMIGDSTPALQALARRGACAPMGSVLPAVTCSAQATMLTGLAPSEHGAVGNGWFERASADLALWRQSNALVRGEKLYEAARRRDPAFCCAKLFWWWNMGAAVDWSVTPRPFYPADGRKIPAVYGWPYSFPAELEGELGPFPFFDFWGPRSGLPSSRWLADAAIRTLRRQRPTLTMLYLPHLDYDLQRHGIAHERSQAAVREVDDLVRDLVAAADQQGAATLIVSEYGLNDVSRPVHVNRALRAAGLLVARPTPAGEVLDVFGSRAFAVADHQIAHVYVRDPRDLEATRRVLSDLPGVEALLDRREQQGFAIDHERSGDLVAVSRREAWFTYYYWEGADAEPDFARTVDIHRKPGYDPCELFLDPTIALPKLHVARRLAQKKLGMRYLMDVIPLDATLVRGSHGRMPERAEEGPIFLCSEPWSMLGGEPAGGSVDMRSVKARTLELLERS